MPTIAITVAGVQHTLDSVLAEEVAALNALVETRNAEISAENDRIAEANANVPEDGEPQALKPLYADGADYLGQMVAAWAAQNAGATAQDIVDTARRAIASWAATPYTPAEPADPTPEQAIAILKAYAIDKRWRVEVGGITLNGVPVPTDDRAKLLLLGAAQTMADGSSAPLVINGINYGVLSKAEFQAINAAVVAHVQATFPVLATVISDIDAGTITTKSQIDAAAWP